MADVSNPLVSNENILNNQRQPSMVVFCSSFVLVKCKKVKKVYGLSTGKVQDCSLTYAFSCYIMPV